MDGMADVHDTIKNRIKVERKLSGDALFAMVDKKGFARFFRGEEEITFSKKNSSPVNIDLKLTPPSKIFQVTRRKAVPSVSILDDVPESPDEE